jgi:hypothetical protein
MIFCYSEFASQMHTREIRCRAETDSKVLSHFGEYTDSAERTRSAL